MPKVILGVKLYSMQETGELLGVTRPTITKYMREGRIIATKIGGKKYFTEENLRAFIKNEPIIK